MIDDESLMGSSNGDYQNFSIDDSNATAHRSDGVVGTMKGWWADDRKRKMIIVSIIASVILLILIIAIAAAAGSRHHGSDAVAYSSSSSSTATIVPVDVSSSSTGSVLPDDISSSSSSSSSSSGAVDSTSSSSTGGAIPLQVSSSSSSSVDSGSSSSLPAPPSNPEYPWLNYRLPSWVSPRHYDLDQVIDIDGQRYSGTVTIELDIDRFIDNLVLHSVGLTHSSINFTNEVGDAVPLVSWYYNANNYNYLVLNFTERVPPQTSARLSIAYSGTLRTAPLSGLYLSTYRDGSSANLTYMASTQFESIGARRAFPCFDEPAKKATFSIAITTSPRYPTVLSNMPGSNTTLASGWTRTVFAQTPIMSTYLLAFVVTDYVYSEQITTCTTSDNYSQNITTRVWALRSQFNSTIIPARIAAAQIAYYCRYFDVAYPLPKEDHIYIPAFSAGAMENWGLITYRDTALLWDPAVNTVAQLQRVSVVIAHELAHQWFGNLVTAAWWSNLWLNEGFATFVEYIGSGYTNPELMMDDQFISVAQREALAYDSSPQSHPIVLDTTLTGSFSSITYAKGGSLIRMMESVLTRRVFLAGIKQYLIAKRYSNAYSTDLFRYLDQASAAAGQNFNVSEFMYEWTTRAGYPLVNCSTALSMADEAIYWTCTQSRFFTYSPAPADNTLWQIPLTGSSSQGDSFYGFWSQLNSTYSFTQPTSMSWLKLNGNSTSFYRVLYSPYTYSQLSAALNKPGFGGIRHDDRLGLVGDVAVFSAQSMLSYTQMLNFTLFLQHDRAFTVWQVAHPVLLQLYTRLRYTEVQPQMYAYMQQALSTAAASINLRNNTAAADQILETVISASIVRFNAAGKRDELQAMYQQLYSNWPMSSFTDYNPNLIALILQAGVADGSFDDWRFVYENVWVQKLLAPVDPLPAVSLVTIRDVILAAPRDRSVLRSVLNQLNATAGQLFGAADTASLLIAIANNDAGLREFNTWIQQPGVITALAQSLSLAQMQNLVTSTLGLNVRQSTVDQLTSFYAAQTLPYTITTTAGASTAAANIAWAARYEQSIADYLLSNQWRTATASSSSSSTGAAMPVRTSSSSSSLPAPPSNPEYPWLNYRLPSWVSPRHYDLDQVIDIDGQRYSGTVTIELDIDRFIDNLVLHSVGLTHSSINFTNEVGDAVPLVSWYYNANNYNYLVLNFTERVPPQTSARLSIAYSGTLRTAPLSGLYLSTYRDGSSANLTYMASTQFESIGARRAFPCFDEPAKKATFSIAITTSPRYPTVLSNMPGSNTTLASGWTRTVFAQTPIMSTYLLAFVVTDYVYSEQITTCTTSDNYSQNITTRVWALRSQFNSTIIPARIAAAQIAYYCRYFDVAYPLPKEDHIYIPAFSAGAMENWGLITYRDTALLWDPAVNTVAQLQRVSVVIAHELAHQWFGNLVTAAWWSNLWLNEGFATFVEYIGSGYTNPELMMDDQFISVAQREALAYDSSPQSHPIVLDTTLTGSFSSITYAKGGSLIRMMESVLTRRVFLAGIKQYLIAKRYSNAYSTDLFRYLDQASAAAGQNFNVSEFMYEWTTRAGYPLVNCSTALSMADEAIYWTCTQSRFFTYSPAPADNTLWQIPLTGSSSQGDSFYGFWSQLNSTYSFTQPTSMSWLKLNGNSTSFYRVLYSPYTYSQLSAALNKPGFGGIRHDDRLGLVGDVAVFSAQSMLSYTQMLNFTLFLQHDRAFTVWQVAHPVLLQLYTRLRYTEVQPQMYAYMQQALSTAAASINLRNNTAAADQILETVISASIVRFNAAGKRDELQAMYQQLYSNWPMSSFTDYNPNLIALILQAGVADGSFDDWRFVYENVWVQKLLAPVDPLPAVSLVTIRDVILAAPRDRSVLRSVLNQLNATAGQLFGAADTASLLIAIANNDAGLREFNTWIQQPGVITALAQSLSLAQMQNLVTSTLGLNVRQSTVDQLTSFYAAQTLPYTITTTAGASTAAANIAWAARYEQSIADYLLSNQWRTATASSSSSSTGAAN